MKVTAFNGSPRKEGNTSLLIKHVFEGLKRKGSRPNWSRWGAKRSMAAWPATSASAARTALRRQRRHRQQLRREDAGIGRHHHRLSRGIFRRCALRRRAGAFCQPLGRYPATLPPSQAGRPGHCELAQYPLLQGPDDHSFQGGFSVRRGRGNPR